MLLIGGQAAIGQHRMGGAAGPTAPRDDAAHHEVRILGHEHRACRRLRHDGSPRISQWRIRSVLSRDSKRPSSTKDDTDAAVIPAPNSYSASGKSLGDPNDIDRLADILVGASRPCVLFGQQVWTCRATDSARAFSETLNIPTYMNGAGRGTLPPDHSLKLPAHAAGRVRRG